MGRLDFIDDNTSEMGLPAEIHTSTSFFTDDEEAQYSKASASQYSEASWDDESSAYLHRDDEPRSRSLPPDPVESERNLFEFNKVSLRNSLLVNNENEVDAEEQPALIMESRRRSIPPDPVESAWNLKVSLQNLDAEGQPVFLPEDRDRVFMEESPRRLTMPGNKEDDNEEISQGGQKTLLDLCLDIPHELNQAKLNEVWEPVRTWLEKHHSNDVEDDLRQKDSNGSTPFHLMCRKNAPIGIVKTMLEKHPACAEIRDHGGSFPLHLACNAPCSGPVIFAVFEAYPSNANEQNERNQTPFCGNQPVLEEFMQYIIECNESDNNGSPKQKCFKRLELCKNHLPAEIFVKAMLEHYKTPYCNGWLNMMSCKRKLIGKIMLEFYLHSALIVSFIQASRLYLTESDPASSWAVAILIIALGFLVLEILQLVQMKTEPSRYVFDFGNWVDCITIALAIASGIKLLTEEPFVDNTAGDADIRQLLMVTAFFLGLFFASYLKKTFFPFSTFIGGLVHIIWVILPFMVVTLLILGVFTFMFFVQSYHTEKHPSLQKSSYAVYSSFVGGGLDGMESSLDVIFGTLIIVVLLNVIIGIVGTAWSDVVANAGKMFWTYRLSFIINVTRTDKINRSDKKRNRLREILDKDWTMANLKEYFGFDNLSSWKKSGVYLNPTTNKRDNLLQVGVTIILLAGCTLLGLFSFGYFWPMFVLEFLFTSNGVELTSSNKSTAQMKKQIDAIQKLVSGNAKQSDEKLSRILHILEEQSDRKGDGSDDVLDVTEWSNNPVDELELPSVSGLISNNAEIDAKELDKEAHGSEVSPSAKPSVQSFFTRSSYPTQPERTATKNNQSKTQPGSDKNNQPTSHDTSGHEHNGIEQQDNISTNQKLFTVSDATTPNDITNKSKFRDQYFVSDSSFKARSVVDAMVASALDQARTLAQRSSEFEAHNSEASPSAKSSSELSCSRPDESYAYNDDSMPYYVSASGTCYSSISPPGSSRILAEQNDDSMPSTSYPTQPERTATKTNQSKTQPGSDKNNQPASHDTSGHDHDGIEQQDNISTNQKLFTVSDATASNDITNDSKFRDQYFVSTSAIMTVDKDSVSNQPPTISDGPSSKGSMSGFSSFLKRSGSPKSNEGSPRGPPPPPFRRAAPDRQHDYGDAASQHSGSAPVRSIQTNKGSQDSRDSDTIISDPTLDAWLDQSPKQNYSSDSQTSYKRKVAPPSPRQKKLDGLVQRHSSSNSDDKKYSDETDMQKSSVSHENPSSQEDEDSKVVDTIVAAALAYAKKTHSESDPHAYANRGSGITGPSLQPPLRQHKSISMPHQPLAQSKYSQQARMSVGNASDESSSSIHSFFTESENQGNEGGQQSLYKPQPFDSALEDLGTKLNALGQLDTKHPHNVSSYSNPRQQQRHQTSEYSGVSGKSVGSMYKFTATTTEAAQLQAEEELEEPKLRKTANAERHSWEPSGLLRESSDGIFKEYSENEWYDC